MSRQTALVAEMESYDRFDFFLIGGRNDTILGLAERWIEGKLLQLANIPTPRSYASLARLNDGIFVIGGFDDRDVCSNMDRYSLVTKSWSALTPIPNPVYDMVSGIIGTRIIVIGGVDKRYNPVDTVWVYESVLNSWRLGPNLPAPRHYATSVTIGESIFVFGGRNKTFKGVSDCYRMDWKNDLIGATWAVIASLPSPRYVASVVVVDDGKVLLIGGCDKRGQNVDSVFEYSVASNVWRKLDWKLPAPRTNFVSAFDASTKNLYIASGWPLETSSNIMVRSSGIWSRVASVEPRHSCAH